MKEPLAWQDAFYQSSRKKMEFSLDTALTISHIDFFPVPQKKIKGNKKVTLRLELGSVCNLQFVEQT